jgi:peptide/nickel transport system permease protein
MSGAVESIEVGGAVRVDRAAGLGPYTLARRRLLRNRTAMVSLVVFVLVVIACLAAPLYAHDVAHVDPFQSNVNGTTIVNGKSVPILQQGAGALGIGTTPIGPTWDFRHYFLGADGQGRDVMARLLYGGRNSLLIATASALICCVLATIVAVVAGFFGGFTDGVLSRLMDVLWAFPVYLLAISISIVALTNGLDLGFVTLPATSLWIPIGIIAIIYIPYVARPIRGQVLSVREKEYIEAAIAQGASDWRLMRSEILPNVITTVIVFFPLMIATTMLTEAALSFLSIGVQPPAASWGTIINDGQNVLYTRPWVAIAPGIAIVIVVLTLNVFGDGLRDALDPRAKLRTRA